MTALTAPPSSRSWASVQERHEELLRHLALRFPWAWRVRLDLMIGFNLLLMIAFVLTTQLLPVAESTQEAEVRSVIMTTLAILLTVSMALYWIFAVGKHSRLKLAARYGFSPGPVTTAISFLLLCVWVVLAQATPHRQLLRGPLNGLPLGDIASPPDISEGERSERRREFNKDATTANLWQSFWFNQAALTPLVSSDYERDDLQRALLAYAENHEPWRTRLSSHKAWYGKNTVLADKQLRESFINSTEIRASVRDHVISRTNKQELEGAITRLVGETRVALMLSEFDEAIKDGLRRTPPSFREEDWRRLESSLKDLFLDLLLDQQVLRRGLRWFLVEEEQRPSPLEAEILERGRQAWEQTKLDPEGMLAFSNNPGYRAWREGLIVKIALAGAFDDVLQGAGPFASTLAEWQKACAGPTHLPERIFAKQLNNTSLVAAFACVIALGLGLFAASVVRTGVGEAFGSMALFGAFSTMLGLGIVFLAALWNWGAPTPIESAVLNVAAVFAATGAAAALLIPVLLNIVKLRQGRWARRLALASVWIVFAWLPALVWSRTSEYIGAPNDRTVILALLLIWVVISLPYAAVVHALLARTGRYPQVG